MSDQIGEWLKSARNGDFQALARLLTWVERTGPRALARPELINPDRPVFRIGITGPPGAGKSTLIGALIREFRARGKKLGILAVDPSSPFTHGAILGDRIRYMDHMDDGVYVRSIGSRGSLGGLSAAAYLMLRAFDLVGFDLVVIETVGVGQTELEIVNVADEVAVVLVPESGDSVQAMKAGLLEIADVFIVNKADRPGADGLARELEAAGSLTASGSGPGVFKTIATAGQGVPVLAERWLATAAERSWLATRQSPERLRWEAAALLRLEAEREIARKTAGVNAAGDLQALFKN